MALSRAIRIASLQLGPISVEAGIHGAVEDEDAGLVSLCVHGEGSKEAPSRIKRRDYCQVCDNDEKDTFRKGKETSGGVVMLDPDALIALAAADADRKKRIELTTHLAAEMGRAFPSGKSYYLSPRKGAENNYALMAQLLATCPDLAFVGEFSFGGAPALYQVLAVDGVLVMRQLARPELVRERPEFAGLVNEQWLGMAEQFARAMATPYEPALYRDRRAEGLAKLVEASAPVALVSAEGPVRGGDLGADLAAALAAAKAAAKAKRAPRKAAAKTAPPLAS